MVLGRECKFYVPGKIEVGHFALGSESSNSGTEGSSIQWVSKSTVGAAPSSGTLAQWSLPENLEDAWKSSHQDANSRLLDDLAFKEDYSLKWEAERQASRQN